MTDPEAFDIEIALSADLDGELADYAAELGTDEPTVRARIERSPGASERRAQLVTARQAVAAPEEPLDEVTRARLVAGALASFTPPLAARDSRPPGSLLRAAAAAAIALVVLGGAITLITQVGGNDGSAAKSAATGGRVRSGNIGDIGAINQQKLDRLIGGPPAGAASSTTEADSSSAQRSEAAPSVNGFDANATARARPEQVTACAQAIGAQGTVRFNGSGAYNGEPAVIVGIAAGDRTVVFVVAAADCARVLYSVSR
ncbi:MAG: hypothetical protein ABJC79_13745 [Acidimicrobiia bacterium]